ncbi:MAG: hypothetical protein K2X66_06105 [Cyanobacteria bacterium]|nr:hypothetical protein [Cyanobacteriota bacterium]
MKKIFQILGFAAITLTACLWVQATYFSPAQADDDGSPTGGATISDESGTTSEIYTDEPDD